MTVDADIYDLMDDIPDGLTDDERKARFTPSSRQWKSWTGTTKRRTSRMALGASCAVSPMRSSVPP